MDGGDGWSIFRVLRASLSSRRKPQATGARIRTLLVGACQQGNFAVAMELLDSGASVNVPDDEGDLPLWMAEEMVAQGSVPDLAH